MLGGYQVLDLRSIDLSHGTSEASISDAYVLSQLLNIRDHIQKDYDFSKSLQNQLKPLLIRYRDKKVGEKHEVALYGNIEVINTYYKFRIIASNEGEQLTINVEFEEKTDDYGNKYWDIKTAKILLTIDASIGGDLSVTGDIEGDEISGNEIIEKMTGYSVTVGITDHTIEPVYAGIVKNGNKLTLVYAFNITVTDAQAPTYAEILDYNLPEAVYDKLHETRVGLYNFLENRSLQAFSDYRSFENIIGYCQKLGNNKIGLRLENLNELTVNTKYYVRYEVTFLLSDNLIPNE